MKKKGERNLDEKQAILVSACLLGEPCRFDGKAKLNREVAALKEHYRLIPVCPECAGGLSTPRPPSERCGGRVVNRLGEDVTAAFAKGAEEALASARRHGCRLAVLKEKSPSCGCGKIYDGSFTGTLTNGNGVTAELLLRQGICVLGESQISTLNKQEEKER